MAVMKATVPLRIELDRVLLQMVDCLLHSILLGISSPIFTRML